MSSPTLASTQLFELPIAPQFDAVNSEDIGSASLSPERALTRDYCGARTTL